MSQSEISNLIYNTIKNAPPFSTLILPDKHIVLPCVVIPHPLTITGSAGTILEIVNGNVVCDFRVFIKSRPNEDYSKWKACISEISLIFKLDSNKICERIKEMSLKPNYNN